MLHFLDCHGSNGNQHPTVHYQIWNVVADTPAVVFDKDRAVFDVLLDKGCFDTILFRTDKRYLEEAAASFLNHVFQAKADGVYLIVTPRRKHTLLQSFQGFRSVERHKLDSSSSAELYKADKHKQSYLYICRKRHDFQPFIDNAFVMRRTSKRSQHVHPVESWSETLSSKARIHRENGTDIASTARSSQKYIDEYKWRAIVVSLLRPSRSVISFEQALKDDLSLSKSPTPSTASSSSSSSSSSDSEKQQQQQQQQQHVHLVEVEGVSYLPTEEQCTYLTICVC
ncbi:hypothetical protein MPSEU_000914800 [Mayamaea pseudoterrestris]|nr:hypothetical protein MPSEU_000914800 [Mayamaea pseudoterrestris]